MVVSFLVAASARCCWSLAVAPALLCCDLMLWTLSFLAFPLRLLAAVDRERKLDRVLGEMQGQMERLVWENRGLEDKLRAALREREAMEEVLDEMEEEHDDAFGRIGALEAQVEALRLENMRLSEFKGKSMWDRAAPAKDGHGRDGEDDGGKKKLSSLMRGEEEEEEMVAMEDVVVREEKAVARRRSLFSLGMSLAVGATVWWAETACVPLLAGLFAAVGMSMCSVARLFRAAARRGGAAASSDAVALLSLNWFLLGVLFSPMLPGAARAVVPRAASLAGPAVAWLAAAAPM